MIHELHRADANEPAVRNAALARLVESARRQPTQEIRVDARRIHEGFLEARRQRRVTVVGGALLAAAAAVLVAVVPPAVERTPSEPTVAMAPAPTPVEHETVRPVETASSEAPVPSVQLADAVRRGPLAVELHYPYHPHVTVAHHLDDPTLDRAFDDLAGFDCAFDVVDFHLYVHHEQEGWRSTRTFPLG